MDVSNVSASNVQPAQSPSTTAALEVQKKAEQQQKDITSQLIESVPEPDADSDSRVGQNINVTA